MMKLPKHKLKEFFHCYLSWQGLTHFLEVLEDYLEQEIRLQRAPHRIDLDHKDPQGLVIDLNDHHLDALPLDQGLLATVESYAEEGKRGLLERNDKFNITYSGRDYL